MLNPMVLYGGLTLLFAIFVSTKHIIRLLAKGNHGGKQPPLVPGSLPILGHLHLLGHPVHQTLCRFAARYGPVLRLRFGSRPVLLVSSTAAAAECLTTNDIIFANRPNLIASVNFGYDCTAVDSTSYGPHWRNLRRLMSTQVLSSARLAALTAVREDEVRMMLRRVRKSPGRVVLRRFLAEMTFNAMTRMVMGKRYGEAQGKEAEEREGRKFRRIVEEVFVLSGSLCVDDFVGWWRWVGWTFGGGLKRKIENLGKEMDGLLQGLVEQRRRRGRSSGDEDEMAVIDELLGMQEADPEYYTDVIIKGVLLTLVSAGTDTVTGTMEWAMSLLLNHPETLQAAKAEIAAHVGDDRLVADSDLPQLHFLRNIIKETLRLFPAAPVLMPHESAKDCTVAGFYVPRGTLLLVHAYAMQRDPQNWAEPTKFEPERFDRVGDGKGFLYIPFGWGRRGCPGEGLAHRMIGLGLASLIQCFDWERVGPELVDLAEGEGLAMPKAHPLEAHCKPSKAAIRVLSQL